MQKYNKPPCLVNEDNRIGAGGNGKVGVIPGSEEIVIKVFSVNENLSKTKRDIRYKRFCREIAIQRKLSSMVDGILPVLDASFPEDFSVNEPAWYTMPRAEKFVVWDGMPLSKKLERMMELAKIIRELHENGMAHRDLKPDNLLVLNGKIYLADYGLVWLDGEDSLTHPTERLGPIKILPPELEEREGLRKCDYKKSDVYLFAKVVWMYVNENDFGYRGEYSRSDPQRCIRVKNNEKTLEPLHQLMEKCSQHDWSNRPSIDECMKLIGHQLMILTGELPEEKQREYFLKEKLTLYKTNIKPDAEVYESGEKVLLFLRDMVHSMKMKIEIEGRICMVIPYSVRMPQDNLLVFSEEASEGQIRRYAMHIHRIEIGEDKVQAFLGRLNEQEMRNLEQLKAKMISGDYIVDIILG